MDVVHGARIARPVQDHGIFADGGVVKLWKGRDVMSWKT